MNTFLQLIIGSVTRHLLTLLGAWLITHGITTDSDWQKVASGLVGLILGIWVWYKNKSHAAQIPNPPSPLRPIDTRGGDHGLLVGLLVAGCMLQVAVASAQTFRHELPPTQDHFAQKAASFGTSQPATFNLQPAPVDQTNSVPSVTGGFSEIGLAMLNTVSNITFIPAVRIPLNGGKLSYLLAGAYPVSDNVVLGGRLDFNNTGTGYSIYGGSLSCTLQAQRTILGVTAVGFVSQAVEFPLSGRTFSGITVPGTAAASQDPFPLTSVGVLVKIYDFQSATTSKSLTVGLLCAYETGWKNETESLIAGPSLNYKW